MILVARPADAFAQSGRPRVGVALGGGSARGIAHVGVLRWLEDNRVPIDLVAGTSIGGLIGGAYATGMTPDEIETLLDGVDWEAMFGASRFQFANVRRKRDLRAYPARLEFGLKGGIVPPPSLNNGQQVDLLLSRIAAGYHGAATFDDLPTPFRCVAVDLKSAKAVVLTGGPLARALRATMSIPLVFPPVVVDQQVLVDGGAMNNIPADVVRQMGADRVIAINVGDLSDKQRLDYSLIGLVLETLDAMIRANTLKAVAAADVRIDVPLSSYGSLDWRRTRELITEGYAAAEAMRGSLLPFALGEPEWRQWRDARQAARRRELPPLHSVRVLGAGVSDAERLRVRLAALVGQPLDLDTLEEYIRELGGLDRYQSLTWELAPGGAGHDLVLTAHPKSYGPPFAFLGISLENTTGSEFRFGLGGRYLAFDAAGSGSELRLDALVGSEPGAGASLYRPLWSSPVFVAALAEVGTQTLNVIDGSNIIAAYKRTTASIGGEIGVNLGRLSEVRAGLRYGWSTARIRIGDPGLPEVDGRSTSLHINWTFDGQDDPVVPSAGLRLSAGGRRLFDAPGLPAGTLSPRTSRGLMQAEAAASWVRSFHDRRRRFITGAVLGTSFDGRPLPTEQFSLGGPLRMSAFSVGEVRGDHMAFGIAGYLHQVMRLPDFLGGPIFLGGWLESGSAFDRGSGPDVANHASLGVIADTLIGPVFTGVSLGDDGDSRFYIGIGRIFR